MAKQKKPKSEKKTTAERKRVRRRDCETLTIRCPWALVYQAAQVVHKEEWSEGQCKSWLQDAAGYLARAHELNLGDVLIMTMRFMVEMAKPVPERAQAARRIIAPGE